ncbi:MAG: nuclear transport factor 2 family protein [Parafilimonas terrae]|nr:nuclear transport factor 2 family protein [Parafilimonas terrae]
MVEAAVHKTKADVVRAYFEATANGRAEDLRPIVADDAVFHYPGQHFISGDYKGKDAVVDLYATLWGIGQEGGFTPFLHEVIEGKDFVVVVLSYRLGMLPNKDLPGRACGLFRVEDGKIKEYWLFEWDQHMINDAFRVVGLKVARKRKGLLSTVALLPRSAASMIRLGRRLYGGYTAPTNV